MPLCPLSRLVFAVPCLFTGIAWRAHAAPPGGESPTRATNLLNGPSSFGLQAHALKDGPAVGADLVIPLLGKEHPLILGQVYAFKGDAELAGIGAGVIARHRLAATRMLEVNAFFDGLRDREGFSYPQLGVGFAYSESWFTFRGNGYMPLRGGTDRRAGSREWTQRTGSLDSGVFAVDWSQDRIVHTSPGIGFDVEVEFQLPKPPRWVDPHLAIGYYYRAADDRSEVHSGLTVRGELHFGENWSLEAEWRDDAAEIGQEYRVVLRYQMWFGGEEDRGSADVRSRSDSMDLAMRGPVERQPWPAVSRSSKDGSLRRGDSRPIFAPRQGTPAPLPDDCCPSADSPLIFD